MLYQSFNIYHKARNKQRKKLRFGTEISK